MAILQKKEEDQPFYKEVKRFLEEYLGKKGEGDYGVKELAEIDDRAKGKVDRTARAAKTKIVKEIGGNA